jgi:surface protein
VALFYFVKKELNSMADKGAVTFSIEAEITGYQSQIKEIQEAFNKLDPGSSIAKSISKTLTATSKQVESYSRNLTQTLSSQEGIEKLKRNLQTVAYNISEMGMALKGASWKDLAEGPAAEVRKLNQEIENVKSNANNVKLEAFDKLFKDTPKLKEVFDSLKIDPKKMGIDQIEKVFDNALKKIEDNINTINEKIAESQNKINTNQRIIDARNSMSAFMQSAPTAASIKATAGQNNVFTKVAPVTDPRQSTNFLAQVNALEDAIKNGLVNDSGRAGNIDLLNQVTQKVTNKSSIFYGCCNLSSLPDISKWNTQNVTNMS